MTRNDKIVTAIATGAGFFVGVVVGLKLDSDKRKKLSEDTVMGKDISDDERLETDEEESVESHLTHVVQNIHEMVDLVDQEFKAHYNTLVTEYSDPTLFVGSKECCDDREVSTPYLITLDDFDNLGYNHYDKTFVRFEKIDQVFQDTVTFEPVDDDDICIDGGFKTEYERYADEDGFLWVRNDEKKRDFEINVLE